MRFSTLLLITSFFGIAHADPLGPILKAKQNSGYTLPQDAFEKTCEVSVTGVVTGSIKKDISSGNWATTTPIRFSLSLRQKLTLKSLIATASKGTIKESPSVCDAGAIDVTARIDVTPQDFVIVKAPDCSPEKNQTNLSPATLKILGFLKTQCQIDYSI